MELSCRHEIQIREDKSDEKKQNKAISVIMLY